MQVTVFRWNHGWASRQLFNTSYPCDIVLARNAPNYTNDAGPFSSAGWAGGGPSETIGSHHVKEQGENTVVWIGNSHGGLKTDSGIFYFGVFGPFGYVLFGLLTEFPALDSYPVLYRTKNTTSASATIAFVPSELKISNIRLYSQVCRSMIHRTCEPYKILAHSRR